MVRIRVVMNLLLCVVAVVMLLVCSSCGREHPSAAASGWPARIVNLACSRDGTTVCVVTMGGKDPQAVNLIRLNPNNNVTTRTFKLPADLLLATHALFLSNDGSKAFMVTTPENRSQAAVEFDLQTGAKRVLCSFDMVKYYMVMLAGVDPQGAAIYARHMLPKDAKKQLDFAREQVDFVRVDQQGHCKVLTPRLSQEMWRDLPQGPRLIAIAGERMIISVGPRFVTWSNGTTTGKLSDAKVLWHLPRHPVEVAAIQHGVLAAIVPDKEPATPDVSVGNSQVLVYKDGTATQAVRGDMASLLSFSPDGGKLACVDLGKRTVLSYNTRDLTLRSLSALSPAVADQIRHICWLTDEVLVLCTNKECYIYSAKGKVRKLLDLARVQEP